MPSHWCARRRSCEQKDPGEGSKDRELGRQDAGDGDRPTVGGEIETQVGTGIAESPGSDAPRLAAQRRSQRWASASTEGKGQSEQQREDPNEQKPPPDAELASHGRSEREYDAPDQGRKADEGHTACMRALAVCAADPDEDDTDYSDGERQRQREAQLLAEDDRDDRSCGSLAGEDRSHNGDRTGLKRGESGEVGRHGHRRGRDRETDATRGQMRRTGCHHDRQDREGPDREGPHQHWELADAPHRDGERYVRKSPQNGREEA